VSPGGDSDGLGALLPDDLTQGRDALSDDVYVSGILTGAEVTLADDDGICLRGVKVRDGHPKDAEQEQQLRREAVHGETPLAQGASQQATGGGCDFRLRNHDGSVIDHELPCSCESL